MIYSFFLSPFRALLVSLEVCDTDEIGNNSKIHKEQAT